MNTYLNIATPLAGADMLGENAAPEATVVATDTGFAALREEWDELERKWEATKGNSRLAWNDAKYAVKDGWHYVERALPGDFDRDGR